jgi:hypothetical protein
MVDDRQTVPGNHPCGMVENRTLSIATFFLVLLQFFEIKPVEKGLAFCSSRWLQLPQIHVQGEDVVKTSSEMLTWMCFVTMALESFASVMT